MIVEKQVEVDPADLDLGNLALFTGLALTSADLACVHAEGFTGLRFAHGFVFQHLVRESPTVSRLAELLGVSQQAASKRVEELERLGYVERVRDEDDARVRRVQLTEHGRAAIAVGRRIRVEREAELAARYGKRALAAARALLVSILEDTGGAEAVRGRRVPWPEG